MAGINDHQSLGCRVDACMVADVPGDQRLGPFFQGRLDGAASGSRADSRPYHQLLFPQPLSINRHKGQAEGLLYPAGQLHSRHRSLKAACLSDPIKDPILLSHGFQRLSAADPDPFCRQVRHAAGGRIKIGVHGKIGKIRLDHLHQPPADEVLIGHPLY